jgi:hypothetical protein
MRIVDVAERVRERAQVVLNRTLPLHVPTPTDEQQSPSVRFDSSKLRSTGLQLSDDLDTEIDALLRYCMNNFGGKS